MDLHPYDTIRHDTSFDHGSLRKLGQEFTIILL
jgi:hypothetical protein